MSLARSALLLAGVIAAATASEAVGGVHDPEGSVVVGLSGGASFGSELSYGSAGVFAGYAVLDGLVPGARGMVLFGDLSGGEVASTLWWTPPIEAPVVPFVLGEIGYAWQSAFDRDLEGPLYGVGGGIHLGEATAQFNLRAGVVYRYYDLGAGDGYLSPLLIAGFRF